MVSPYVVEGWNALLIFLFRHWMEAVANALVTVALGYGIISVATKYAPKLFPLPAVLSLRRIVLLAALYKCALFLVLGEGRHRGARFTLIRRFHAAGPPDFFDLGNSSSVSLWNHSSLAWRVTLLLACYAAVRLAWRAYLVWSAVHLVSKSAIHRFSDAEASEYASSIEAAAHAIRAPQLKRVPIRVLERLNVPTPFVLGFLRPCIVITADRLRQLSEANCLELAIRHELMHIRRLDHLLRWLQICLEDIAGISCVAPFLLSSALRIEEHLCDFGAITDLQSAAQLAHALALEQSDILYPAAVPRVSRPLEFVTPNSASVTPALLGLESFVADGNPSRAARLQAIATYAGRLKELHQHRTRMGELSHMGVLHAVAWVLRTVFSVALWIAVLLLVGLVVYTKLVFALNV